LALWKIINEEDTILIPKNRGENFSNGFLHSLITLFTDLVYILLFSWNMSDLKGTNDENRTMFHYLISIVCIITMSNKMWKWWKFNRINQNLCIQNENPSKLSL
jgi:hypothetical protein